MLQDNDGTPLVDRTMEGTVCSVLEELDFEPIKATTKSGTKDFLEKIVQLIRGTGFGIAIFSQFTNATSLANIFFEVGLCNMLGKPVILVKNKDAKAPSDFIRTEWVTFSNNEEQLRADLKKSLKDVVDLSKYFEILGEIAFEAKERDIELAFERYKQALLINGDKNLKSRVLNILSDIDSEIDNRVILAASKKRLRKAIIEFSQLVK